MSTQQLTREEIARVFALYMFSKVHYRNYTYCKNQKEIDEENERPLDWKNTLGATTLVTTYAGSITSRELDKIKLLLTPLSRISDEDAIEVAKIIWGEPKNWSMTLLKQVLVDLYRKNSATLTLKSSVFINQYLISKGYAVPLFFALSHWANGKTAIELGIAI